MSCQQLCGLIKPEECALATNIPTDRACTQEGLILEKAFLCQQPLIPDRQGKPRGPTYVDECSDCEVRFTDPLTPSVFLLDVGTPLGTVKSGQVARTEWLIAMLPKAAQKHILCYRS